MLQKIVANRYWAGLIIVVLGFCAYSFVLDAPFKTRDDYFSIVENQQIRSLANVPEVLNSSYFGAKAYWRPLVMLSYMVEYHMAGLNSLCYYLNNIFLHLLNALVVFFLLQKIGLRRETSFVSALLFTIHPIQWEAVANISGRSILLSAFFILNSFLFFLFSLNNKRMSLFCFLSLICFCLGLMSKESAGILPMLLIAYLLTLKPEGQKKGYLSLISFFGIIAVYLFYRRSMGFIEVYHWRNLHEHILGMITALRGNLDFVRMVFLPLDLHFDRSTKLFDSFAQPGVWIVLAIFCSIVCALYVNRKKISGIVWFLIAWVIVELFPTAQVVAAVGTQPGYISTAEHFMYLPAVGLFALSVLGIESLIRGSRKISPKTLGAICCAYVAFLYCTTIQMAIHAKTEISMFERTAYFSPHNIRVRNSLALIYARAGRFQEAEGHFRGVLKEDPNNLRARIGLGKSLCDQGQCKEALVEYMKIKDAGEFQKLLEANIQITKDAIKRQ